MSTYVLQGLYLESRRPFWRAKVLTSVLDVWTWRLDWSTMYGNRDCAHAIHHRTLRRLEETLPKRSN